ncbi:response regulator transcription factor [Aggregicoccus sp. 17bor-14]|uniref:LytR/AlgR family response regulator transcription factor n=1 Tax=Myxococcaceae TaxID=31 RepID=UPI00129C17DE|nr:MULTISPECIES: LytTR family DNA-binding domain-containing protein [Myxococcaceae]MBF5044573.1 response regulator transcription factor [Simulacricoccus sp. 17bor-14]MRI90318.1 response regulator transcription factor [Aggregicoccus sp. 17bor-14]
MFAESRLPPPLHTLLVDDEPAARAALRELLERDPELELVGECASGREALRALQQAPVDLLLLDVGLPDLDGFELLREAGPGAAAAVLFVTGSDAHALHAFDVGALHYLLKPLDAEQLARGVARAKERVRALRVQQLARQLGALYGGSAAPGGPEGLGAPATQGYLQRLALKETGRVTLLPVEEVDWVEADDYYVQVHAGGRSYLLRQSLRALEGQLDPRRFLRIHRSTLVNVARVRELQPLFHGEYWVVLQDGSHLKLSRSYRERLDALLAGREPQSPTGRSPLR